MTDDLWIQLITLFSIVIGIYVPIQLKTYVKRLITFALSLLILGFMFFLMLVMIQTGSTYGLYIFYVSMFFWMTGFVMMITIWIIKIRRS